MKIGLLMPSLLMAKRYRKRVFAPGELFLALADELSKKNDVYLYCAGNRKIKLKIRSGNKQLETKSYPGVNFKGYDKKTFTVATELTTRNEYEIDLTSRALFEAQKIKLDIIHDYGGFFSHYLAKLVDTPICYTIHNPRPPEKTLDYCRYKLFPNDNYIAISKSQIRDHKGLINFVDVVYHGVKLNDFTFYKNVNSNSYLAFLGRYLKVKGVDIAIAVSEKLKLPLKIAGSSNYKTLDYYKKEIRPHLKPGLISETGYLNPQTRNEFFKNAKALLFPIRWAEPFGMVVIEAMACGIPVIAFARGAVPELVKDGVTGFLVPPERGTEGFIGAAKKLYSLSESEYLTMRRNCRKHVEENFTSEVMARNYEKVYRKIIAK